MGGLEVSVRQKLLPVNWPGQQTFVSDAMRLTIPLRDLLP